MTNIEIFPLIVRYIPGFGLGLIVRYIPGFGLGLIVRHIPRFEVGLNILLKNHNYFGKKLGRNI